MPAWLFTILRNLFRSEYRKRRREVEDADGKYAATLSVEPDQMPHLDFEDLQKALTRLPHDQREAVLLVGASGFSYEQAAEICGCAVGTIKSRVNRARNRLAELMHFTDLDEDLGADRLTRSVVQAVA
jgi:RNA polymerase sigma-70 factor (ECF subfamily)